MNRHDSLFGTFQPTGSWIERWSVGWTYLLVLTLTLPAMVLRQWPATAACLAAVVAVLVSARLGARAVRLPWPLVVLVLAMAAYHVVFGTWLDGVVLAGNVVLAVLASRLLTMTKPIPVLLDGLVAAAAPLRWVGLSPERFGLAVTVMLRSIPYLAGSFGEVRDAARARGLDRNPLAHVTPVVVRAVGFAQATGDALAARGLGDDD